MYRGTMEIPEKLLNTCKEYFNGQDTWFYICHPALGYSSPYAWLRQGKDLKTIEDLLNTETTD